MRLVAFVAAVLSLSACTKNESIGNEPPRAPMAEGSVAPPSTGVPSDAPPKSDTPAKPAPIVAAPNAEAAPSLGAACTSGPTCGVRGRVAVRAYSHRDFRPDTTTPCKLVHLGERDKVGVQPELVRACVSGDRLYVYKTCIICRIASEGVVEAAISELSPEQLAYVQAQSPLFGATPLRTVGAWEKAIESARHEPK
jgi:hypothetical protein